MRKFIPYFRYLKPVRWQFAAGLLAGIVYGAASGLGLPLMMKVVLPVIFGESQEGEPSGYELWMQNLLGSVDPGLLLILSCLWIPLIFLIRSGAGYLNAYLVQFCGFRILEQLREEIFAKLQTLPLSFFQKHKSGDLLARLTQDTEMVRQVLSKVSSDIIKQPAMLLFAIGALFVIGMQDNSAFVMLIALLSVPLCVLPIRFAGSKVVRRAKSLQRTQGDLSAGLAESLQSPMEVRAYNLQEDQKKKFGRRVRELLRLSMKVVKYQQAISPIVEFVAALGFAAALYIGVQRGLSMETFLALGTALYMAYEPVKRLGKISLTLKQGTASLERIEEILHSEDKLPEPDSPKQVEQFHGEIVMEDVTFSYGDESVLAGVSVRIPVGQCVALVGPSGGGKSTFANLIPRFFDPDAGAVRVDGEDLRNLRKADLRDAIAVVPQMPVLFIGTIKENILIGRMDASDEEVEAAARAANAHDFILEQENGYDTEVSEKGSSLSGGQRQRIALARAFLKDAPILILDEATSALDTESEMKVQEELKELIKGKTTLIIAHRMSTTRIAERVLVFDRGKIVEDGPAENLRAEGGVFSRLVN